MEPPFSNNPSASLVENNVDLNGGEKARNLWDTLFCVFRFGFVPRGAV